MAKNTYNYGMGPWDFKKDGTKDFVPVTAVNRTNAIIIGRILYVIAKTGNTHQFRGTFTIDPCFTAGAFRYPFKPWQAGYPGHTRIYMPEPLNYDEWKNSNDFLITKHINEKTLYIKPSDPILQYFTD